MPRKLFFCDPTRPYHVSSRCINKEWFDCPIEKVWELFCRHQHFGTYAYGVQIHAFVLMSNHFHMLISAPNGNLSDFMCFLLREVSRGIQHQSDRINQTFAERFRRTLITTDRQLRAAYKYVYQNPVRARIVEFPTDYRYSSLYGLIKRGPLKFPLYDTFLMGDLRNLDWLNQPLSEDNTQRIRRALRRPRFKIAAGDKGGRAVEEGLV